MHILDTHLSASDHGRSARWCKNWPNKSIGSIQITFYILTWVCIRFTVYVLAVQYKWAISAISDFYKTENDFGSSNSTEHLTLDHKTSLKCEFFEIGINTSSESWINKLSIDVWYVRIGQYLDEMQLLYIWNISGIWGYKKIYQNFEKTAFKVVQMKFLAMHITYEKFKIYLR